MLKEIPKGTTFIIRLVSPLQAGFCNYIFIKNLLSKNNNSNCVFSQHWTEIKSSQLEQKICRVRQSDAPPPIQRSRSCWGSCKCKPLTEIFVSEWCGFPGSHRAVYCCSKRCVVSAYSSLDQFLFLFSQPDSVVEAAVEKINTLLENFMGINDSDLGNMIDNKCHFY